MRLWLSKNSEVPLHQQLVTQIILGIVSKDLAVAERLPSTRDLARRYQVHANTVSAAYRELAKRGWVEFRKGSGVYVRDRTSEPVDTTVQLDQLIASFFKEAHRHGFSLAEIQSALDRSFKQQPPDHFLLIEPDPELREILVSEIAEAARVRVVGSGLEELDNTNALVGAVPMVLFGHAGSARQRFSKQSDLLVLHSASVVERMRGQTRPPADALVAIVSRWPEFRSWARTMLIAAGLDAESLSIHDARESGWEKGLRAASFVITDSVMVSHLPKECDVKVFRVISNSSLQEIRDYAERYFRS